MREALRREMQQFPHQGLSRLLISLHLREYARPVPRFSFTPDRQRQRRSFEGGTRDLPVTFRFKESTRWLTTPLVATSCGMNY